MAAIKTTSTVDPSRLEQQRRTRFSPVRGLDPERLSSCIERFELGDLREFAMIAEAIADRDDILKTVIPKRKKAVSRHPYEVLTVDESPEANRQKEVLEAFWNSVTVTDAADLNQRGGFRLLVRQMMDAVAKRYAVHEIVWKPGKQISAEFRFVPLWFFENRTGRLQYLKADFDIAGVELEPNGWMVTVGDGLMLASSIAWMFKNLPLKDWVTYSERHGMPGIRGVTAAARDSKEWTEMESAVRTFASEFAAVMAEGEKIEKIDLTTSGELPYPALVERMDRALITLWRGADLGTISKGQGVGSTNQADESSLLEEDDIHLITETLQQQVERFVLQYHFGPDVVPLAYVQITPPQRRNLELELKVDDWLLRSGAPISVSSVLERYGRPPAEEGAVLLTAPAQPAPGMNPAQAMANELEQVATLQAFAADLAPVRDRLERILQIQDPELMQAKLTAFVRELPQLARDILADPASGPALAESLSKAFASGVTEAAANRK